MRSFSNEKVVSFTFVRNVERSGEKVGSFSVDKLPIIYCTYIRDLQGLLCVSFSSGGLCARNAAHGPCAGKSGGETGRETAPH